MDGSEIARLIPELLDGRYPGKSREPGPRDIPVPGGRLLEIDNLLGVVRPSQSSNPFLWIRIGVAIEIPRSNELAYHVACANKKLMVGRAYLGYGDTYAMVVLDETVLGPSIRLDFQPSMQDLVDRFETTLTHAREFNAEIVQQFGGRGFQGEEWVHLVV
jgi:hypothetical protein